LVLLPPGDWVAGKYEKLEKFDEKFQQLSKKMEPGNIGNTNPGKRGANLVSGFTSMFEQVGHNFPVSL